MSCGKTHSTQGFAVADMISSNDIYFNVCVHQILWGVLHTARIICRWSHDFKHTHLFQFLCVPNSESSFKLYQLIWNSYGNLQQSMCSRCSKDTHIYVYIRIYICAICIYIYIYIYAKSKSQTSKEKKCYSIPPWYDVAYTCICMYIYVR